MLIQLRHYLERNGFYVSTRLADRLGMRAKTVRLSFIWICPLFGDCLLDQD